MRPSYATRTAALAVLIGLFAVALPVSAQGNADPLAVTGLDRFVVPNARLSAMGWAGTGAATGAGALFTNPALLTLLTTPEVRIGGLGRSTDYEQRQEWYPDKVYATLSLIFEQRLTGIVDTALKPLEHAYDKIGPNWKKNASALRPSSAVAAVPIDLGAVKLVAAAGYGEVTNLDHYFQNNNAMTPYLGAFRPAPIPRPALGETVKVAWFQYFRQRTGSLYGFTPGLALTIGPSISIGGSATILTGSTDDLEESVGRGRLRLTTSSTASWNVYFIDSIGYHLTSAGTSDYSGVLGNLGVAFRNANFALGATFHLPSTITRSWTTHTAKDTMGAVTATDTKGEDKLALPLSYTVGLAFYPKGGWTVGIDYVVNRLDKAVNTPAGGGESHPWLAGNEFRVGVEYPVMDAVRLRAGYREDVQVFTGEGAAIQTDPVRGSVYSAGAGLQLWLFTVDIAYEYSTMSYHDTWESNVNYNDRSSQGFSVDVGMSF